MVCKYVCSNSIEYYVGSCCPFSLSEHGMAGGEIFVVGLKKVSFQLSRTLPAKKESVQCINGVSMFFNPRPIFSKQQKLTKKQPQAGKESKQATSNLFLTVNTIESK